MNETIEVTFCQCSNFTSRTLMIATAMIGSIIGNGITCILFIRFKTLRTVPNILIVNLAIIDILNGLTNMPLFIMWYICKLHFLKGRALSWFIVTWYVLFMYLTVVNLTVLTLDRFGAIVLGFRYHSWKTLNKAKIAVLFVWFLAAAYTYGMFILGLDFDIGDVPVLEYRIYYFKNFGRYFIMPGYLVPFSIMLILGVTIWRTVSNHRRRLSIFYPHLKQVRSDVKTAKTIFLTVIAFLILGILPMSLHSVAKKHGTWLNFLAYFLMDLNSMVNPIIYSLRTRRFRKAFLLLLKDPFGTSQPYMTSVSVRRRENGSQDTRAQQSSLRDESYKDFLNYRCSRSTNLEKQKPNCGNVGSKSVDNTTQSRV